MMRTIAAVKQGSASRRRLWGVGPMHPYKWRSAIGGFDQGRIETEYEIGTSGYVPESPCPYPPFQLLLMSRIQSGDGTGRTDAEDEEHKPFSHGSASSSG
jgi:hypothetical protein